MAGSARRSVPGRHDREMRPGEHVPAWLYRLASWSTGWAGLDGVELDVPL